MNTSPKTDEIEFQYYSGNIKNSKPIGKITLTVFINAHKFPTKENVKLINAIHKASIDGDKKEKARLKFHLPYFTPAAIFDGTRKYTNLVKFTGIAQLDFDKVERSVALKDYIFNTYEEVICCYLSPSGKGVKALIKIPKCKTINEYREYYAGLINEFNMIDGFDPAPKNAALPLFLSYDTDILFRQDFETWKKKGKVMKDEDYNNLIIEPPPKEHFRDAGYRSPEYFERITIQIFKNKVNEIVSDNGHPRLRNACLVLGSRVSAGYLDYSTALAIAEYETKMNRYLQKDISNYLKTVCWAINEGMKSPKYYK